MTNQLVLDFDVLQKELLNSNSLPSHFIVKGKMVSALRDKAARAGMLAHPEEIQTVVDEKLLFLAAELERGLRKKRLKKRLEAEGKDKKTVEAELAELFPADDTSFDIPPLFNKFRLELVVFAPTKRRVDPPNLWPSLKALGDGLTDAGLWVDDSFEYMVETSFRYGGLSGVSGVWKLRLIITELEDLSNYQLVAEIPTSS